MAVVTSSLRSLFATKFSSSPTEQQRGLVEAFRDVLPRTHLRPWRDDDPVPAGEVLLVGVMVGWNTYDQELVAALDEAVADGRAGGDVVAVFAADDLTSPQQLEAIFPGLGSAGQSPYIGLWEDGRLRLVDGGASAMAFLTDRYGLKLP